VRLASSKPLNHLCYLLFKKEGNGRDGMHPLIDI